MPDPIDTSAIRAAAAAPAASVPVAADHPLHEPHPDPMAQFEALCRLAPDEIPEVIREAILIDGVLDSVRRQADELRRRLGPVSRELPPGPTAPDDNMPEVASPLAARLRQTYRDLQALERSLATMRMALSV